MDWKAFVNPQLLFNFPMRTLGMLCAAFGVLHAPFDLNNRYLFFGFFLICLSFAVSASSKVYRLSSVISFGEKTPHIFSPGGLLQALVFLLLTIAFALVCLHQWGLTPRLDAYLSGWLRSHCPL